MCSDGQAVRWHDFRLVISGDHLPGAHHPRRDDVHHAIYAARRVSPTSGRSKYVSPSPVGDDTLPSVAWRDRISEPEEFYETVIPSSRSGPSTLPVRTIDFSSRRRFAGRLKSSLPSLSIPAALIAR
jgi:hypothetical protein